jgi:hypothetical protein
MYLESNTIDTSDMNKEDRSFLGKLKADCIQKRALY